MASTVDAEKEKIRIKAQAEALAAQKSGGQHYSFDGSNVPGYDPKTGAVMGGVLDNNTAGNFGAGLREGVEGILGGLGDVGNLAAAGVNKVGSWLGMSPEAQQGVQAAVDPLISSQDVRDNVTDPLFGKSDPAIGPTEKLARTAGNFGLGAFMPGGVVPKMAAIGLPTAGTEIGGMVAPEGYEDVGRMVGGIVGGGLAAGPKGNPIKEMAKDAPSAATVKKGANTLYDALRREGIEYDPSAYAQTAQGIKDKLIAEGYRPAEGPEIKAVFDYIDTMGQGIGMSPQFNDIESMTKGASRKMRSSFAKQGGDSEGNAWSTVVEGLHDFEKNAPFISKGAAAPETVNKARTMARGLALKNIKQRALDGILEDADLSAAGRDAGIRNGVRSLLRSNYGKGLFNSAEKTVLLGVAQGNKPLQALSKLGLDVFGDSGNASLVPLIGNVATSMATGDITGGIASSALGTVAKGVLPKMTEKKFSEASDAIRSGKMSSEEGRLKTQKLMDDMKNRKRISRASTAVGTSANQQSGR